MRLILGLGNPGKEYERSRHNLGFDVVDRLALLLGQQVLGQTAIGKTGIGQARWKVQCEALVVKGVHNGAGYLLAKPQTYMNNSGRSLAALLHYYKVDLADCLVIADDLDLDPGKIRQRTDGSDGGHRGLRSIEQAVGTKIYKRMRIGIGRPQEKHNVISYVLGRDKAGQAEIDNAVEEGARSCLDFIQTGRFENWSSS